MCSSRPRVPFDPRVAKALRAFMDAYVADAIRDGWQHEAERFLNKSGLWDLLLACREAGLLK